MLTTKNRIFNHENVPSYWVFQYYINLDQTLSGQNVKIKSIWNTGDTVPSMCIYVDTKRKEYLFKDFSTDKQGDKITFVMELFDISYPEAIDKIIKDYNEYVANNGKVKLGIKPQEKWQVSYVDKRNWNSLDAKYWLQYNIGSSLLDEYNVFPIEYYNLTQQREEGPNTISITNNYIYGYYNKYDELCKIYQPKNKNNKFLKIKDYIQGFDQLSFQHPILIIASSLKDALCLKSFGYKIDVIAPDSENTIIKPYIINNLKSKYNHVVTLLDNDQPGIKAMNKYLKLYGIKGFTIELSKDFSDSVKDHGMHKVHEHFKTLLKQCIK